MSDVTHAGREAIDRGLAVARSIKEADDRRPGFPGEHLLVLGTGIVLLMAAGRVRSPVWRFLAGAAGSAFIGRAASGRGGLARVASLLGGRTRL